MEWKTEISDSREGETIIRGYKATDLIAKATFTQSIFLVLTGKLPTKNEERLFNAILVSSIDHGLGAPSTTVARFVASTGNQTNAALAAGILAQGKYHGGAIEDCMLLLQAEESAEEIVNVATSHKKVLAGFGHKIYTTDPRTTTLFTVAKETGHYGKFVEKALAIEAALEKQKGKKLCVNVDGAIAALLCELGIDASLSNGIFAISRVAGLVAHVAEEKKEKPYRRLDEKEYSYTGGKDKKWEEQQ